MDSFGDLGLRLSPLGLLAWRHSDRMSMIVCDTNSDKGAIDLEVELHYATLAPILDEKKLKVRGKEVDFNEEWDLRAARILNGPPEEYGHMSAEAWRLQQRLEQYGLLTRGAAQHGVLEPHRTPLDTYVKG